MKKSIFLSVLFSCCVPFCLLGSNEPILPQSQSFKDGLGKPTIHSSPLMVKNLEAFQGPVHQTFLSPTERFIEKESWCKIKKGLQAVGLDTRHKSFFDQMVKEEKLGFFGYHGSTQNFRLYEDIVRWVVEEKLGIPIGFEFHFFRIPGEETYQLGSLKDYGSYLNQYQPTNFICLNYTAFSNYKSDFFSSYYYFATNTSSSTINYEEKLQPLFDELGIDPQAIKELLALGHSYLDKHQTGVIYQFFDTAHLLGKKPYSQVDPLIGTFAPNDKPFSETIEGDQPTEFFLQTRLLINNQEVLNPFSSILIKRYEQGNPQLIQCYEKAMKRAIGKLNIDVKKVDQFKKKLCCAWYQNQPLSTIIYCIEKASSICASKAVLR